MHACMSKAHPREREQAHSDPSTHTSAHVDRPRHGSRSVPTQQRNQRNESWKRTALSCTQSCGNANTKPHESCTHPIAIRCNTTNEILIRTFRKGHNSLHQRLFFHALLLEDGRQTLVTRLDVVGNSGWVNGAHLVCSNIGSCVLLDDVAFVVLCVCSCVCVCVCVCTCVCGFACSCAPSRGDDSVTVTVVVVVVDDDDGGGGPCFCSRLLPVRWRCWCCVVVAVVFLVGKVVARIVSL